MLESLFFLFELYWKNSKLNIILLFLKEFLKAILPIMNIVIPKYIIDGIINHNSLKTIYTTSFLLIIGNLVLNIIINEIEYRISLYTGQVFNDFQIKMVEKISTVDYEQIESNHYIEIEENAKKFLYGNYRGFGTVLLDAFSIFGKIITFVGIIGVMLTLNVWLVLLFITLVILSSLANTKAREMNAKIDFEKMPIERKTSYFMNITSKFEYGKEIRIGNLRKWIGKKYRNHINKANEFYRLGRNIEKRANNFNSLMLFIRDSATYIYLVALCINGAISIGSFSMYISAILVFTGSMNELLNSLVNIYTFKPYYNAVKEFFNLPSKLRVGKNLIIPLKNEYTIEFKNVSFKYPGSKKYSLENISLILDPQKKYSIVGENGAGKSTFIKLLTRMYDPTEGEILLNGINIKDYAYDEYMNLFSVVFQDFKLFSFSLGGPVRKMRIYNAKELFLTIPTFLTTLRYV